MVSIHSTINGIRHGYFSITSNTGAPLWESCCCKLAAVWLAVADWSAGDDITKRFFLRCDCCGCWARFLLEYFGECSGVAYPNLLIAFECHPSQLCPEDESRWPNLLPLPCQTSLLGLPKRVGWSVNQAVVGQRADLCNLVYSPSRVGGDRAIVKWVYAAEWIRKQSRLLE